MHPPIDSLKLAEDRMLSSKRLVAELNLREMGGAIFRKTKVVWVSVVDNCNVILIPIIVN